MAIAISTLSLGASCGDTKEGTAAMPTGGGGAQGNLGGGGNVAAGGAGPPGCPAFKAGMDLAVCTATYLSGPGDQAHGGIAIAADGTIAFAGPFLPIAPPASFDLRPGATEGISRLSADGRQVLSQTSLGNEAFSVAAFPNGDLTVNVDNTVVRLSGDGKRVVWSKPADPNCHLATGKDGTVAALGSNKLLVYDEGGTELAALDNASRYNSVAVDGVHKIIFVTGFKQDNGPPCTQLQIPFIHALSYDGKMKWKAYDWNHMEVGAVNECADTRGIAVAFGQDGKLYYTGESHGGNTVHRRLPQDLAKMAATVKNGPYSDPYNLNGAAPIGFVGRFNPETGELETGTYFVTRLTSGKGNSARPVALAADANGRVVIGGNAACCIEAAEQRTIGGVPAIPPGTYGGGAFALVLSADLKERLTWTTWNGAQGGGAVPLTVAANAGTMAILLQQSPDADKDTTALPLITQEALLSKPGGKRDLFLSVWKAP